MGYFFSHGSIERKKTTTTTTSPPPLSSPPFASIPMEFAAICLFRCLLAIRSGKNKNKNQTRTSCHQQRAFIDHFIVIRNFRKRRTLYYVLIIPNAIKTCTLLEKVCSSLSLFSLCSAPPLLLYIQFASKIPNERARAHFRIELTRRNGEMNKFEQKFFFLQRETIK